MPASLNGRNVVMPATSYAQSWSTSVDGSGVKIGRSFAIPGPGGRTAEARVVSKLTGRMVLGIGARALAAGSGVVGAGMLAYDIYDAYRMKPGPTPGSIEQDPGKPPGEELMWFATGRACPSDGPGGVASCMYNKDVRALAPGQFVGAVEQAPTCTMHGNGIQATCSYSFEVRAYWPSGDTYHVTNRGWSDTINALPQSVCEAVVDPFDSTNSLPKGSPIGPDGKCRTGRYSGQNPVTLTPEQAANVAASVERSADEYKRIMDEILGKSPVPIPKGAQTQIEEVTPAALPGPTTTTTGPEGTVETATGWDFGRISQDLAEDFNAGRWNETVKKTTTKPDGTKSEETTKEEGTTPQEEAAKDGDPCKVDPARLGCIGLGEAPQVDIPKATKTVELQAESIGGGGSCPAPRPIGNLGTFSFTQLCDGLVMVKPLIILLGLFASGLIVVNALRA